MNENMTYSCPNCKAILVIPKSCWLKVMRCTRCDKEMKLLDDEFDLAEIIEDEDNDTEAVYHE